MVLSWYLILRIYFPELFIVNYLIVLLSTPIAKLAYILCFVIFLYHFLNAIRHLSWNAGRNLEITSVSKSAILRHDDMPSRGTENTDTMMNRQNSNFNGTR